MKLYVGNLSFNTSEQQLRELFEPYGVTSAQLAMDRESGRPRGFGFVEVTDSEKGNAAVAALHGKELDGRTLTVNEAKPREPRSGSFGARGGPRKW
jgi:RNA recognition motif-containing protein